MFELKNKVRWEDGRAEMGRGWHSKYDGQGKTWEGVIWVQLWGRWVWELLGKGFAGKARVPGTWKGPEVWVCVFENTKKVRVAEGSEQGRQKQEMKAETEWGTRWAWAGTSLQGLWLSLWVKWKALERFWEEEWHDLRSIWKAKTGCIENRLQGSTEETGKMM